MTGIRLVMATFLFALPSLAWAQSAAQPQQAPPQPPPTDTETPAIAGVAAAGTKVVAIKAGFQGTEGPIGMPDGTLIFTETQANRITRIAADGTTSTFLENTNGSLYAVGRGAAFKVDLMTPGFKGRGK